PKTNCKNRRPIACFETAHPLSTTQSAVQRRVADSCGKRGKLETLEAQPKRLNSLPAGKRPPAAERNDPLPKEMKRVSNSDKPPPPPHSKKGVYLHAKRVHYNHTTYTKGGNYKWIKQN
uniref:hypothetical protein n=1 Tax=Rossellomorea marisflavi TaxID=189381 RepID=UPI0035668AED